MTNTNQYQKIQDSHGVAFAICSAVGAVILCEMCLNPENNVVSDNIEALEYVETLSDRHKELALSAIHRKILSYRNPLINKIINN